MKKTLLLGLTLVILSGCGVTIKTVVLPKLPHVYKKPLIVIPYGKNTTKKFVLNLKKYFEQRFAEQNNAVDVLVLEQIKKELSLNPTDDNYLKIDSAIKSGGNDLVILFQLKGIVFSNQTVQDLYYQVVGIDNETQKEVWKADLVAKGVDLPSIRAKGATKKIFLKLKEDKVIE